MPNRRQFVLSAAAALATGCSAARRGITIGSKNFTEQLLLGELLAQQIAARTAESVNRRFYLAGSFICQQAILAGRIDAYVEYTGTALTAILKQPPQASHDAVFDVVRDQYRRRFRLAVLPSLGFDNSFAIAIRGEDAARFGLRTISNLASRNGQWRMGVGYEFLERPDGYAGLARAYGLRPASAPRVMDLGLLYRAIQTRQVDVIAGSNTDGLIAALGLVVLEDDRHYFPPYDAVPVLRAETAARSPQIEAALRRLAGRITAEQMRRMNYAVDGEHRDAAEVAAEFLRTL
ncbi:MAG: ABC transporter substrate-binding protein [Acidobacteria bacterium]|nr:ABC transporter substrate-binding protein [Acidobacteriota bacterium]